MRIGLFGGTFDPVHLGHLLAAQAAREEALLDRLVWIPAGQSPFKPEEPPTPADARLRLLRTALAGDVHSEVSRVELDRPGHSYTVDTLRWARARWPGASLFWLIGEDHLSGLPRWRDAAVLAEWAEFLVIPRPNAGGEEPGPAGFRCRRLRGWPFRVSASEIRQRLAQGRDCRHLLPPGVAEAIQNSHLYGT